MSLRLAVLATLASVFVAPAFAASERFEIDSSHTYPSLEMSHMGLSVWRGKFNRTTGHIDLDRAAKTGSVDVAIETASIDFGLDAMNEHALADDSSNSCAASSAMKSKPMVKVLIVVFPPFTPLSR